MNSIGTVGVRSIILSRQFLISTPDLGQPFLLPPVIGQITTIFMLSLLVAIGSCGIQLLLKDHEVSNVYQEPCFFLPARSLNLCLGPLVWQAIVLSPSQRRPNHQKFISAYNVQATQWIEIRF